MLKNIKTSVRELRTFLILWITQSFSELGSAMTNFAWSSGLINSRVLRSLLRF